MTTIETPRDVAVRLAEDGFRVFPLVSLGKTPAVAHPFEVATSDPARAAQIWAPVAGDHDERNVAVATGGGLIVIDFDTKPGQHGLRSLFELEIQGLLPDTRTVKTPSGGLHLYYRVPPGCRVANSVGKIASHTDVRAENGYVVAPGSIVGGAFPGQYVVEKDLPIADAHPNLIERCGRARDRQADATPLVDLDTPEAIARATEWLCTDAAPSFKGSNGDATAYRVACGARDFGISETTCLELMLDHWNERGSPQWEPDRLAKKVEHAYQYALKPAGSANADAEFGALPPPADGEGPVTSSKPKTASFVFAHEAAMTALDSSVEPLVEGILDRGTLSTLFGPSNSGKSFVALDIAYHIAAGKRWRGRDVTAGLAVYVAAEGGGAFRKRVRALHDKFGFPEDLPLAVLAEPFDLTRVGADSRRLVATVKEAERASGQRAELIVIDTLAMTFHGDENTAKDMGSFMRTLTDIRLSTGAHVMVIHHTGKNAENGPRGSNASTGAVDTELLILNGELRVQKRRDDAKAAPIRFTLEPITLGEDSKGRPITSCVVGEPDEFGNAEPLTGGEQDCLDALKAIVEERTAARGPDAPPSPVVVSTGDWDARMSEKSVRHPAGKPPARQTISGYRRALTEKGYVKNPARSQWLIVDVGR